MIKLITNYNICYFKEVCTLLPLSFSLFPHLLSLFCNFIIFCKIQFHFRI